MKILGTITVIGPIALIIITVMMALAFASPAAHDAERSLGASFQGSVPPPEFDKPYTGDLTIWRIDSHQIIRETCVGVKFPPEFESSFACIAPVKPPYAECTIFLASDELLRRAEIKLSSLLRHELAHCNGWPGDHPNAPRKAFGNESQPVNWPLKAKWLRAYPPLVCLTPDGKEESCAARQSRQAKTQKGRRP
jgi:hypothetical protein